MKMETEMAVRSVLLMDAKLTKETVERALDILRGKADGEEQIVHNVRFKDARDILKVSKRTLRHYIDMGCLDRVFGAGERAIGITRESIIRFMTGRRVIRKCRDGLSCRHGNASETPGRHWARELRKGR